MRYLVLIFCVLLGTSQAAPVEDAQASVTDILDWLDNIVEHEGQEFLTKVANLLKNVEDGIIHVKDLLPKIHERIHKDADRLLEDIKDMTKDIMDFISRETKGVYYGFGVLDEITNVAGGFKLSTAIRVLQLAGSAQKVFQDAQQFEPRLQKKLDKIEEIIEKHVSDLASELVNELGTSYAQSDFQQGVIDFLEQIDEKFCELVVDLISRIQDCIQRVKQLVPKVYTKFHEDADKVLEEVKELLKQFQGYIIKKNGDVYHGIEDLEDIASFVGGFKLSTAIKLLKLADSAHKVIQDAKEIEPKLEKEFDKMQNILEKHVHEIASHFVGEFDLGKSDPQSGMLKNIDDLVEKLEDEFYKLAVELLKQLETGIQSVKEMVPQVEEQADKVLNEIKKIIADIEDYLYKEQEAVYYGFGILDDLTDMAGGFKLSTAIRLLQLVESARKVCTDAKQFEPRMEKEVSKVEGIIEKHVGDLATHIFEKFDLGKKTPQQGARKEMKNSFYKMSKSALDHVESGIQRLKELMPQVYTKIHQESEKILEKLKLVAKELKNLVSMEMGGANYGYTVLDDLEDISTEFRIGTATRVLELALSAQKVYQDAKELEPKLEEELNKIEEILKKHISEISQHISDSFVDENKLMTIFKAVEFQNEGNMFEEIGEIFRDLAMALLEKVKEGLQRVTELIPKTNEKIHMDANRIMKELVEIYKNLQDSKIEGVLYGFGILDDLTSITGGIKLSTAIRVLQLAESAHKVCQDAKEFEPKFESEFEKVQGILEKHISDFATHLVNELGLENQEPKGVQKSIVKDIAKLLEDVEETVDTTIVTLFKDIEGAIGTLQKDLPEVYNVIEEQIREVREEIRDILQEIVNIPQFGTSYGFLDIAGTFTKGTTVGRVIRIVLLVGKFNAVMGDAKSFGPHAEVLLKHSADKVAKSAEDFFLRAADIVLSQ